MQESEQLHILLVEDDEIDAEAMLRALQQHHPVPRCTIVTDGIEALQHLQMYDRSQPTIIVLDLNLPRMGGIEFLSRLRADPKLRRHIVFVLTTSDHHTDKIAAYDRHIAGYCVKGRSMESYHRVVKLLHVYRHTVTFPPH